jgi:LacI family transcriptional regulator
MYRLHLGSHRVFFEAMDQPGRISPHEVRRADPLAFVHDGSRCYILSMATRMKDIAADLGLSVVTISKVLRNHPDIGEETRERVLQRIKELDYQPNIMARSLVTGRSYLVGLIVPDLLHPFFAEVAKSLSTTIRAKGYYLIVSSSEEDPDLEYREIRQLQARRLDALVVASAGNSIQQFEQMQERGEIFMLIDRDLPGLQANYVGINDEAAGRLATEHLIDMGCKRIAHIRGRENSTGTLRYEGYRHALSSRGLVYDDSLVISRSRVDTQSLEQGEEAMRLLLRRGLRPDGVFCYNDPLAIGAINAILEAGLRVPEDISVIGCGNLHYDGCLRVALSSIDQKSQQIGQRAGELVISLIESKQKPRASNYILEPTLVIRASTERTAGPGVAVRRD